MPLSLRALRRKTMPAAAECASASDDDVPTVDIRRSPAAAAAAVASGSNAHLAANVGALALLALAALAFVGFALNVAVVLVGVLNPAWQTYKALEAGDDECSSDSDDDDDRDYVPPAIMRTNWASYWLLAGLLFVAVQLLALPAVLVSVPQPLVPALLVPVLLYLTRDGAKNSRRLYLDAARPVLRQLEHGVDGSIDAALKHVEYFSSVALVQFYAAIEPYAAQLRRAANNSARTIQQGKRPRRRRSARRDS